jgi:hypothetical protein
LAGSHGLSRFDIHGQNRFGIPYGIGFIVRHLNSTRLASTSGMHLRLDHTGQSNVPYGLLGLFKGKADMRFKGKNAPFAQKILGLIFMQLHWSAYYGFRSSDQ